MASLIPLTVGIAKSTKTGSTCLAEINGVVVTVQVARDLTVAVNDALLIQKKGNLWIAMQRLYAAATTAPAEPPIPVPDPAPTVVYSSTVLTPVETRTYRNGVWRSDTDRIYMGNNGSGNNTGVAFYGTKGLGLSGVTVESATLYIRRARSEGDTSALTPSLWAVAQNVKPVGAPTLGLSHISPDIRQGQGLVISLTATFAQQIVDGTAGGIGVYHPSGSPYIEFTGRSEYAASFTLTLNWRR